MQHYHSLHTSMQAVLKEMGHAGEHVLRQWICVGFVWRQRRYSGCAQAPMGSSLSRLKIKMYVEPAMCARSPEDQPYPGLHQEKSSQQVEGGDSVPLLW